jgi:hypothetical protein
MSTVLTIATLFVVVGWVLSLTRAFWRAHRSHREARVAAVTGAIVALWAIAELVLARAGVIHGSPRQVVPPVGINLLVSFLVIGVALWASPTLRALVSSQSDIIRIQGWRLAGVLLLTHMILGDVPTLFGLPAGIGDILVGATAFGVARAVDSSEGRRRALIWNALGVLDLVVAVSLGVMTSAGPTQVFHTTPSSEMLTVFPLALVPAFIVPQALALHAVSLWQLVRGSWATRSGAVARVLRSTAKAA